MDLTAILIFVVGAMLYGIIVPAKWRGWVLMVASVAAIYWLQPRIPLQPLDFVLPTGTLLLSVMGWYVTRRTDTPIEPESKYALGVLGALIVVLAFTLKFLDGFAPPREGEVAMMVVGMGAVLTTLAPVATVRHRAISILMLVIVVLFIVLKAEPLAAAISGWLRAQADRPITLARASDLQWLGFSYVAFRLIHTLRDRQSGRLPDMTLREYITYMIFFPAFTAGPIDRAERFIKDYQALPETKIFVPDRLVEGFTRIAIGILKKFLIADYLALFALNAVNAGQVQSAVGLWILLYSYSFRLFFDFSGYSDIAIGIGILYGIKLPENFNQPYLKTNITAFWQSWHMTLSNWARFYVFTPLSRALMSREKKPSIVIVILICQVATMLVIGLWHGITLNFLLWGLWHGIGLWAHKLFTDRTRTFYQGLNEQPQRKRLIEWAGVLFTFHFVALGWVWFALPDTAMSFNVLTRLFGIGN